VDDFRRVRSRRAYAFHQVGTGVLVARGVTDWVFLDTATRRPAPIPGALVDAFYPEGDPPARPRPGFPAPAPPPREAFAVRRTVEWRDIDPVGHVNNAVYLAYLQECGVQVAAAHGWTVERMEAEGLGIVARGHQIEYREPALLGDELELTTWITGVRRATILRYFAFRRIPDGKLVAQANTRWVGVDQKTRRPVRAATSFLQDFAPNISPEIVGQRP
jgi:acyl-CoA thioester hydrolase